MYRRCKTNYEEALELRQKLLKTDPENVVYQLNAGTILNNRGDLFFENDQKEEAKENFKKALEILESLSKKNLENKKLIEELNFIREKFKEL